MTHTYTTVEGPRVIKQAYHRNGVGGEGFVVSLIDWPIEDEIAPVDKVLTKLAGGLTCFVAITHYTRDDGTERLDPGTTAVLNLPQLVSGDIESAWRGADNLGKLIVEAWEEQVRQRDDEFVERWRGSRDAG